MGGDEVDLRAQLHTLLRIYLLDQSGGEKSMRDDNGAEGERSASQQQAPLRLVPSMMGIARSTRALLGLRLAAIGLFAGQEQLLLNLEVATPSTVIQLATRMAVRASTVSKMTDLLVSKGWVQRSGSSRDGRLVHLTLTDDGAVLQAKVRQLIAEIDKEITAEIAKSESRDVLASVARVDALLAARVARLR